MTPPPCPVPGRWVLDDRAEELGNVSPELWPEPLDAWVGEGGHCGGGVYDWGGPVGPCALEWLHEGECEA